MKEKETIVRIAKWRLESMPGSPDKNFLATFFKKSCVNHKSTLPLLCETANTQANALKNSALKVCRFQNSALNLPAEKMILSYLAEQAVNLLDKSLGYFYAQTITYRRVSIATILPCGVVSSFPKRNRHALFRAFNVLNNGKR